MDKDEVVSLTTPSLPPLLNADILLANKTSISCKCSLYDTPQSESCAFDVCTAHLDNE